MKTVLIVVRRLAGHALLLLGASFLAWKLSGWPGLPGLLGLSEASLPARFMILSLLAGLAAAPLAPLFNAASRRQERQADRLACRLTGRPGDLADALIKLARDNLTPLCPHPLYARLRYTHPPLDARLAELHKASHSQLAR